MSRNQLISAALRLFRPEPPMRAAEAAEMLGVSVERIRQYSGSGELDRADVGGRDLFVTASSVRRRLARIQNRGHEAISTLALTEIPQAGSPLPLIYDRLATGFLYPSGTPRETPVHLRAWADDELAVVLVASCADTFYTGLLDAAATDTAAAVFSLLPHLRPERTAVLALEGNPFQGANAYMLMDSVLTVRNSTGDSPSFEDPIRSIVDFEALAEKIGQRPVIFHRSAYTPENVETFTRTGRPVTAPWDPDEHLTREENLHALAGYTSPAAALIRDLLLDGSRMLSNRPSPSARDGELDGLTYPWTPQGSVLQRQHASPETVDEIQRRFANQPDGLRFTPRQAEESYRLLVDAANDAGTFGRDPDPLIERLASSTLGGIVLRTDVEDHDVDALIDLRRSLEERYPLRPIVERTIDALHTDPVMSEYADGFTPHETASDLQPHERAHIAQATSHWRDEDLQLGRDLFGRPAALSSRSDRRRLLVLEDTRQVPEIRVSDEIVSGALGGDIDDVSLLVRRDGRLVGMIPIDARARSGHNLGYPGGGPVDASTALSRALLRSGFSAEQADAPALERLTTDRSLRDRGRLEIAVRDLCERAAS
ncbi:helix-turn-helix domain-containing protein [Brachybacterium sp. ACRRE]|uniref:helix-turn-helix domain-containing protein n=1 Tax=Brachybacterium sp. ACRRE TaxID=2918184 RepID=UPI001EF2A225|nr:helix-turn-helix domain-containing protein [Brachybacterium sp. ACRRE]MCG7308009.1 helix-turn-helix domain-containing protein [Brachybacterium sp. ACRRE]